MNGWLTLEDEKRIADAIAATLNLLDGLVDPSGLALGRFTIIDVAAAPVHARLEAAAPDAVGEVVKAHTVRAADDQAGLPDLSEQPVAQRRDIRAQWDRREEKKACKNSSGGHTLYVLSLRPN